MAELGIFSWHKFCIHIDFNEICLRHNEWIYACFVSRHANKYIFLCLIRRVCIEEGIEYLPKSLYLVDWAFLLFL